MRRKVTDAQKVGARRETLDASEARRETRDIRRVSSLSSCNLVSRLTSHAPAPWPKVKLGEEGSARHETIDASIASSLASKTARVSRLTSHALWPTVLLGEVTIIKRGKYITRNDTSPGDVPVILGGQEPAYYCDKANHTGPCVVISRSGASAGFVSYWAQPIFVTDGFLFEANEQSNIRYVYYCLKANQSLLGNMQNGTGIPHVRGDDLKSFQIPLPPLPVQRRIADVLSAYDDLIENNRRRIAILEETARLAYRKWFGGSEQCRTATLGDILEVLESGSRPRGGAVNDGVPSIGAEKIESIGIYDYSSEKYVSREYYDKMRRGKIRSGDVLLYKDGAYTGKVSMALNGFPHVEAAVNEHVFILRTRNLYAQCFLYCYLRQQEIYEKINTIASAKACQPGLNQSDVLDMEIEVPTDDKIGQFENKVSPLFDEIVNLAKQNAALAAARDMLLPRLMKGFNN